MIIVGSYKYVSWDPCANTFIQMCLRFQQYIGNCSVVNHISGHDDFNDSQYQQWQWVTSQKWVTYRPYHDSLVAFIITWYNAHRFCPWCSQSILDLELHIVCNQRNLLQPLGDISQPSIEVIPTPGPMWCHYPRRCVVMSPVRWEWGMRCESLVVTPLTPLGKL